MAGSVVEKFFKIFRVGDAGEAKKFEGSGGDEVIVGVDEAF